MDEIQFQCSGCGKILSAPANRAGKNAKCPSCGGAIQVPQTSDYGTRNPPAVDGGSAANDRIVTLACPQCASPLQVTRQLAGKMARCNKCRTLLSISTDPLRVIAVGENLRPTNGAVPVRPAPTRPEVPRVPPASDEPSRGATALQIPTTSGRQDGSPPSDLPQNVLQEPATGDGQDNEKTSQPFLNTIGFACSGCGRNVERPADRNGKCPSCGTVITIPAPAPQTEQTQDADKIKFACSQCSKDVTTTPDKAGKTAKCPACGFTLQIPKTRDYYKQNLVAAAEALLKSIELRSQGDGQQALICVVAAEQAAREVLASPCLSWLPPGYEVTALNLLGDCGWQVMDDRYEPSALNVLGHSFDRGGRLAEAQAALEKALVLGRSKGYTDQEVEIANTLCSIYALAVLREASGDNLDKAAAIASKMADLVRCHREAEGFESQEHSSALLMANGMIDAMTAEQQCDYENALALYNTLLESPYMKCSGAGTTLRWLVWTAYMRIGRILFLYQWRIQDAISCLQNAVRYSDKNDEQLREARSLLEDAMSQPPLPPQLQATLDVVRSGTAEKRLMALEELPSNLPREYFRAVQSAVTQGMLAGDGRVQLRGALILTKMGDESSTPVNTLIANLSPPWSDQVRTIKCLALLGLSYVKRRDDVVSHLVRVAQEDMDPVIRASAMYALAATGNHSAREFLDQQALDGNSAACTAIEWFSTDSERLRTAIIDGFDPQLEALRAPMTTAQDRQVELSLLDLEQEADAVRRGSRVLVGAFQKIYIVVCGMGTDGTLTPDQCLGLVRLTFGLGWIAAKALSNIRNQEQYDSRIGGFDGDYNNEQMNYCLDLIHALDEQVLKNESSSFLAANNFASDMLRFASDMLTKGDGFTRERVLGALGSVFVMGYVAAKCPDTLPHYFTIITARPVSEKVSSPPTNNIQFQCSRCSKSLNASANKAGQSAKCPSCGAASQIPQPDHGKRNRPAVDDGSGAANRPVTLSCPRCANPLQVTRQLAGKVARCNKCRTLLSISEDPLRVIAVGESHQPTNGAAQAVPVPAGQNTGDEKPVVAQIVPDTTPVVAQVVPVRQTGSDIQADRPIAGMKANVEGMRLQLLMLSVKETLLRAYCPVRKKREASADGGWLLLTLLPPTGMFLVGLVLTLAAKGVGIAVITVGVFYAICAAYASFWGPAAQKAGTALAAIGPRRQELRGLIQQQQKFRQQQNLLRPSRRAPPLPHRILAEHIPQPSVKWSDTKCSRCKYLAPRKKCACCDGQFFTRSVEPTHVCPRFELNPAQDYWSQATVHVIKEDASKETITQLLEAAIQGGLPEDEDVLARTFLASDYADLAFSHHPDDFNAGLRDPLLSEALKQLEHAVRVDVEQRYGVFAPGPNRAMLARFDTCYTALICEVFDKTLSRDALLAYLKERDAFFGRVPGDPMIYLLEALGIAYYNRGERQTAKAYFQRMVNSELEHDQETIAKMKDVARKHLQDC